MGMDSEAHLSYGFIIDEDEDLQRLPEAAQEDVYDWVEARARELGLEDVRVHFCGADGYLNTVVYAGSRFGVEWAQTKLIEALPDRSEHLAGLERLRDELGLGDKPIGWHLSSLFF